MTGAPFPAEAGARPGLVIFDLDGCLIDSEPIALDELVRLLGEAGVEMTIEAARDRFLGGSIGGIAAWAAESGGRLAPEDFIAQWHGRLLARYRRELKPMPGAVELLEALRGAGIPFRIATGGSVRRMTESLTITGLDRYFAEGRAHSADAVPAGKPAPDLFLLAAAAEGVAPAHCLVIEDAPAGVTAAARAGMPVIGFVGGSHLIVTRDAQAERLRGLGAGAILDDLDTLRALLTGDGT